MAYIGWKHVQWMERPDSKKRMTTRWVVTVASMWASVYALHKWVIFNKAIPRNNYIAQLAAAATVATLPMLAFEVARPLAHKLFPKPPKTSLSQPKTFDGMFDTNLISTKH